MARKTSSRIQKRKEAEAAVAAGKPEKPAKKKRSSSPRTSSSRKKSKAAERKRLIWGVFSGGLKEEARFPYDQRAAAEERLEQLKAKGKKSYFIQPIKEVITDAPPAAEAASK